MRYQRNGYSGNGPGMKQTATVHEKDSERPLLYGSDSKPLVWRHRKVGF